MARKDTLYISDMDGTLLGADSRVSETSREIITDLSRRGYNITVATARTPATVVPLLEGTFTRIPAVVMTGAALWHRSGVQGYADTRFFSSDLYGTITDLLQSHGISPFVYTLPAGSEILEVYHNPASGRLSKAETSFVDERRHLKLKHFHLSTPAPAHASASTLLFFAMGQIESILTAADYLRKNTPCSISAYPDIFTPDTGILEILAPGVSKASAIEELARRTGAKRTVVFGDNLNDLPMMATATEAVAVANALPQVKAAAAQVIDPNTESSVARFILED